MLLVGIGGPLPVRFHASDFRLEKALRTVAWSSTGVQLAVTRSSPDEYLIRRATDDDTDALSDLAHRAKAHWNYPTAWMRQWDAQLTILPGYLEMHDVWVADLSGTVVGMCALEDRGDRWNLEHVWVDPAVHRRGIGRTLVCHALGEAWRRRPDVVELLADPFATGFYERLGAHRTGNVPAPMPGAKDRTLPRYEFLPGTVSQSA